jgi:O-antigen ligase
MSELRTGDMPTVSPAAIVVAALLAATLVARLIADGRAKYGVAILLVITYGPLVLVDLAAAVAIWLVFQFFSGLSAVSSAPSALGILMAIGWASTFVGRPAVRVRLREHRRLLLGIIAFGAWLSLTLAWAHTASAAGNAVGFWWLAMLGFLIVLTAARTIRDVQLIVLAFVIGAVAAVAIGLAGGGLSPVTGASTQTAVQGRLTGGGGDPNVQAASFVAALFLIVGLFSVYRSRAARLWLLGAFVFITIGFLATQSRGGLVGLAAATVGALLVAPRQRRRILALAAVMATAAAVLVISDPGTLSRITDLGGGTSGRSDLWHVAWTIFTAHPVFGIGIGNFQVVEPHYALLPGGITRIQYIAETPQLVHNTYLQLLTETGIIGLAGFLAIIVAVLRGFLRALRTFERKGLGMEADLTLAVLMGTIAMLTSIFFITNGQDYRLWVLFALAPALGGIARRATHRR